MRVLHIFHEIANGGVEAFVMNNYRHIDREKVQFDFLTTVETSGYFDEEIERLGGKLYRTYPLLKNPIKCYEDIKRIVHDNGYDIVHRHAGSAFGYFDLRAARAGGAKHLVMHSHNPQARTPILHKPSQVFLKFDSLQLACSKEAGEHMFGKNSDFIIFPNAIECDKYVFNEAVRKNMRRELDIAESTLVVGHIGRFEKQKNHKKLLEIFADVHKVKEDSILICVGVGTLFNEIEQYAEDLGIKEYIRFLGSRNDVPKILQIFDIFCFPSLYEGFSLTQIEAQVNGLPCYVSKNCIPKESDITGNVYFVPLEDSADKWAKMITDNEQIRDLGAIDKVRKAGYDIKQSAAKLLEFYISLNNK